MVQKATSSSLFELTWSVHVFTGCLSYTGPRVLACACAALVACLLLACSQHNVHAQLVAPPLSFQYGMHSVPSAGRLRLKLYHMYFICVLRVARVTCRQMLLVSCRRTVTLSCHLHATAPLQYQSSLHTLPNLLSMTLLVAKSQCASSGL